MANPKKKSPDAMKKDMDANADSAKKIGEEAQKAWDRTKQEGCNVGEAAKEGTCGVGQKANEHDKKADVGKK
jgi:hypothetical protein